MSFDFENPQSRHKFFMKWDTLERKSYYKVPKRTQSKALQKALSKAVHRGSTSGSFNSFPFTWKERNLLSQNMTAAEVLQTSEYIVDNQKRRQRKWKEIRHFWKKTVHDRVYSGCLENAFWPFGNSRIDVNRFVVIVAKEYKIVNDLDMESHLRWLYYSLEGGKEGIADWREFFSAITVMTLFRLIKKRPEEVLMKIFDVYSAGGGKKESSLDDTYITDKEEILRILKMPVLSDFEEASIVDYFDCACAHLSVNVRIYRQDFKTILYQNRYLYTN